MIDLAGARVVLAEDDADTRDLLTVALEQCGAQVHGAATATAAVTLVETVAPHALVTDFRLPGDAAALTRTARERRIAVVVISGVDPRTAPAPAVYDILFLKPVDPFDICRAVQVVYRGSSVMFDRPPIDNRLGGLPPTP